MHGDQEYALSLDVDFYSLLFKGHEEIVIVNSEKELILDSFGLKIKHA